MTYQLCIGDIVYCDTVSHTNMQQNQTLIKTTLMISADQLIIKNVRYFILLEIKSGEINKSRVFDYSYLLRVYG